MQSPRVLLKDEPLCVKAVFDSVTYGTKVRWSIKEKDRFTSACKK